MGLLVLRWSPGKTAFEFVANQTVIFLEYTNNGTAFTYGFIAAPGNITDNDGNKLQPVLAFSVGFGMFESTNEQISGMHVKRTRKAIY